MVTGMKRPTGAASGAGIDLSRLEEPAFITLLGDVAALFALNLIPVACFVLARYVEPCPMRALRSER